MDSITMVSRLLWSALILGVSSVIGLGQTTNVQGDLSKWFEIMENENIDSALFVYDIPFFYIEEYKTNPDVYIDTFDVMTPEIYSYLTRGLKIKSDDYVYGLNMEALRYRYFKTNLSNENFEVVTELLSNKMEFKKYNSLVCPNYEMILGQDTIDQIKNLFDNKVSEISISVVELQFQKGSKATTNFWCEIEKFKNFEVYFLSADAGILMNNENNVVYLYDNKKKQKEQIKALLKNNKKKKLKKKDLKKGGEYVLSDGTKVEIIK